MGCRSAAQGCAYHLSVSQVSPHGTVLEKGRHLALSLTATQQAEVSVCSVWLAWLSSLTRLSP